MSSSQSHSEREGRESQPLRAMTLATLRRALDSRHDGTAEDGELRRAVRALADHARERALRAEQLVAVIQETWRGLPEMRSTAPRSPGAESAARLIGVCIDEFYAGLGGEGDGGGESRETDHGEG